MKTFYTTTGFGVITLDGEFHSKFSGGKGEHKLKDEFDFMEVEGQSDLDDIEFEQDIEFANSEKLIADRIRKLAIDSLKADGYQIDETDDSGNVKINNPGLMTRLYNFLAR